MSMNYKYIAGGLIVLAVLAVATTLYPKDFKQMIVDNPDAKYLVTFDVLKQEGNVITPDDDAGYLRWRFTKDSWDSYYWGRLKEIESSWRLEYYKTYGDDEWVDLNRKVSTLKMNYTEYDDYLIITKSWDIYKYASNSGTAGTLIQDVNVYTDRIKVNVRFVKKDENDKRDYRFVNKLKNFDPRQDDISSPNENEYWLGSIHPDRHQGWWANVIKIDEPEKFDYYEIKNEHAIFYYKAGVLEIDPTITLQTADTENLEDAFVSLSTPTTNYGNDTTLRINPSATSTTKTYIKFNIDSILTNSSIVSATLALWNDDVDNVEKIGSYCLKNATWGEGDPTWNYLPGGLNTTMESYNTTPIINPGFFNISVSLCVNQSAWLYDFTNVSFLLKNESTSGGSLWAYSKEYAVTAQRPKLYITYESLDEVVPLYTLNRTNFTSTNFPSGYQFNTTWTDNAAIDQVFFEGNFSGAMLNYSATANFSSEYYLNYHAATEGDHKWRSIANDTNDKWNTTEWMNFTVSATVDSTFPLYTLNRTNFTSTTYPSGYQFNVTWEDDVAMGIILIEGNFSGSFANYTISTKEGNETYYNIGPISGGDHKWRSIANDTSGNVNATGWMNFTVGNGTLNAWNFLNTSTANVSGTYPFVVVISGNTTSKLPVPTFNLYILNATNYSIFSTSSAGNLSLTKTLGVGTYSIVYNSTGNTNWTSIENRTLYIIVAKSSAQNCELFLNGSQLSTTLFHDQIWNITVSCGDAIQASISLNATGYGDNFSYGTSPLTNFSQADLYHSESNYNITAVCDATENYSQSSAYIELDIDPGILFYLNASLQFTPSLNSYANVEPTYQEAGRPAICVNNTRAGTTINVSIYTKVNITTLYNFTLFGNTVYYASTGTLVGMRDNETWFFNNLIANNPQCLYLWANFTKGVAGTWNPKLYADAKLS